MREEYRHDCSETLTRTSDELGTPNPRRFHTNGNSAKIVFAPTPGTPYTGIFREQTPGLARFSYAGPPIGIGIVPGLGLKFPVEGDRPSENAVLMRTLDPQSQHLVFENAFTNILPVPRFTNLIMRAVKLRRPHPPRGEDRHRQHRVGGHRVGVRGLLIIFQT